MAALFVATKYQLHIKKYCAYKNDNFSQIFKVHRKEWSGNYFAYHL
jgi:hypothetical protein